MGKKISIIVGSILHLILIAAIGAYSLFSTQIKAINTIAQLKPGLYYL